MRTFLAVLMICFGGFAAFAAPPRSPEYEAAQQRLARGWNTWDVHSVTAHVLLPEGFTLRLGLKHNSSLNSDAFLGEALIGRRAGHGEEVETVFPGAHLADGRYSELRLSWRGHEVQIQSAHAGADLVLLVTPHENRSRLAPSLVVSAGVLWNRPGSAGRDGTRLEFTRDQLKIPVFWTATAEAAVDVPLANPHLAAPLVDAIGISTGRQRSLVEIRSLIEAARPTGTGLEQAIESVVGWDTIYEPSRQRVVSPVSRLWCVSWGGYVLFDWDTYFAASLAATISRDLAYANAVEITREATPAGFVPNYARAGDWKSFDRSEPPVGAITLLSLYRQFGDVWPLRDTFDALLTWNRWWMQHRDVDGYLVWATDPNNGPVNPDDTSVGTKQGAMYESGLDNSPMFDAAAFDPVTGRLLQADAGLMGLYVADCDALAEIAGVLGRAKERDELTGRATRYRDRLRTLWDEAAGIFVNRDLKTGASSARLSPTNLYPLLARAATRAQADRMIREQLLNPAQFGGRWVLPSISRSDPAFKDQEYWRGRVWGPMNYLVYLGLQNYDAPAARRELAEKSRALFELEWREHGHVHENYNAITGSGDDVTSSDRFYHWGALLALISLMENRQSPPVLHQDHSVESR